MAISMQEDPAAYWNEEAGPRWVTAQAMLDATLAPVSVTIVDAARLSPGERVLDIGCGAGALSLAARDRVGAAGEVVGVDISAPLVQHASKRAGDEARFLQLDAEEGELPASDVALSRFGTMFFQDTERALTNIARALKPGGRCAFACWQPPSENPWLTWPVDAIRQLLPETEPPFPPGADVPGPFRFADPKRLTDAMRNAGFAHANAVSIRKPLSIPGSAEEINDLFLQVGPLSRALADLDERTAAEARARVHDTLASMHDGNGIELAAAWWIVTASV